MNFFQVHAGSCNSFPHTVDMNITNPNDHIQLTQTQSWKTEE